MLVYRLPPGKPGALAVAVRRRLVRAGAAYLAKAVAALPESAAAQRVLRRLRSEIGEAGGSAEVPRAEAVGGESDMVAAYNAGGIRNTRRSSRGAAMPWPVWSPSRNPVTSASRSYGKG